MQKRSGSGCARRRAADQRERRAVRGVHAGARSRSSAARARRRARRSRRRGRARAGACGASAPPRSGPAGCVPTPGRSTRTAMPCSRRCAAGPMPESISSCGVLKAPPHRITSRRARTSRASPGARARPAACARYRRSPLRYSTPRARAVVVEEDAGRERIELDVQPVAGCAAATSQQALARAGAAMAARRQRRVAEALEAAAAASGRAFGSPPPRSQRKRARQRRRQAADEGSRRAADELHQLVVAERVERDRLLGAQPAVPAVPGRIDAEPAQRAPQRARGGSPRRAARSGACAWRATTRRR